MRRIMPGRPLIILRPLRSHSVSCPPHRAQAAEAQSDNCKWPQINMEKGEAPLKTSHRVALKDISL